MARPRASGKIVAPSLRRVDVVPLSAFSECLPPGGNEMQQPIWEPIWPIGSARRSAATPSPGAPATSRAHEGDRPASGAASSGGGAGHTGDAGAPGRAGVRLAGEATSPASSTDGREEPTWPAMAIGAAILAVSLLSGFADGPPGTKRSTAQSTATLVARTPTPAISTTTIAGTSLETADYLVNRSRKPDPRPSNEGAVPAANSLPDLKSFRVGLQAGHWKSEEFPDELSGVKGLLGASGEGWNKNAQILAR